jgi:hypothetical protein
MHLKPQEELDHERSAREDDCTCRRVQTSEAELSAGGPDTLSVIMLMHPKVVAHVDS